MAKPFSMDEVVARVRALIRRVTGESVTLYKIADLTMNLVTREVFRGTRRINLTAREFRLLEHLLRMPGQVVTRTQLIERVWQYHFDPGTNLVDVYIQRLRRKIDDNEDLKLIHTVRGVGYSVRVD
jgi:DNA-binding response OmpR family regulator